LDRIMNRDMAMTKSYAVNGANGAYGVSQGISVVVPVYNEEESVPELYERTKIVLAQLGRPWEIIFVDDGSQDKSPQVMDAISRADPHVKTIKLRRNFGQTAALSAGIDHAQGSVIIPMDADLQNDPTDIPRLLSRLEEGYDIVSGWRRSRKDSFLSRSLPSLLANKLASWVSGMPLHDYGCTLKAYRREVLKGVHLYGELHRFIPALASAVGARVAKMEVTHHPQKFGKSKYGVTRTFRVMIDLITLKLLLTYYSRPCGLLAGLGS
jgi:glycosyltransferase involved in cell wall biosynthesis